MAASNRAARITKLVAAVKKQFKPVEPSQDRALLESLLFACLLQNSSHEAAESAFGHLSSEYFDWNEVRVSTRHELAQALKDLNDPNDAADRLKRTLQGVFEGLYSFDLEALKKQNLGQTVKQFQSYKGITPFVISYVTQTSLGGHSIPVNSGLFTAFVALGIVTEAEAKVGNSPGLERAIPKAKGVEVGSLLHQLGVEVGKNPYGQNARKLLLAIDPNCKESLPKRPAKPSPRAPKKKPASKAATPKKTDAKKAEGGSHAKPAEKKPAEKKKPASPDAEQKPSIKKKTVKKTPPPKKAAPKKSDAAASKPEGKKVAKKVKKKVKAKRKPK